MWNDDIIELSNGRVNDDNVDAFNCRFFSKLNSNHDSDIPIGEPCNYAVKVDGMLLKGSYIATWTGDPDYPDETIPADIMLESVDGHQVEMYA